MDKFLPFSSSNANSFQELSMDLDNNPSPFTTIPTFDDHHQAQAQAQPHHLLPPYSYQMEPTVAVNSHEPFHSSEAFPHIPVMQPGSEFGSMGCNPGLRQERGGFLNPHMTKMARINRKKAMNRSRNNSSPSSSATEFVDSRRRMMLDMKNNLESADKKDLYRYISFDNKKLRVLLVKHLKNSDVGSLGRIVLPKREAEENLPKLSDKEGIIVKMRDVNSMQSWSFKYKFWSNNKSRMYVLENTGGFVKKHGVETGDSLTVYEDESKNLYVATRRNSPDKQNEGREDESMELNVNHFDDIMFDYIPNDEEIMFDYIPNEEIKFDYDIPKDEGEDSMAMLMGNPNDHYPFPDDLMGLTVDHQAESSLPPMDDVTVPQQVGSSDDHLNLDDFVW